MRALVFAISAALFALPQSAPAGGRIEGTVLRTGGNEPIAGARVTLTRINAVTGSPLRVAGEGGSSFTGGGAGGVTPNPRIGGPNATTSTTAPATPDPLPITPLTTDGQGRFAFTDVDPGTYRLAVLSPGYVRQEYGQRIFPGQGTLLNLAVGQSIRDLTMHLTQTGSVNGRITDSSGQIAVNVPIQLLRATYNAIGQKTYTEAGSGLTNDRGEYRIYWITPGRYVVTAGSPPGAASGNSVTNDPGDYYSYTFYPGVSDPSRASTIDIQSGSEASADFAVARQQPLKVRGRVVDGAGGRPPASINVSFAPMGVTGGSNAFNKGQIYDSTTGVFEVRNILPGPYIVQVSNGTQVERASIEVGNINFDNLVFTMGTGANVTGRARIETPTPSLSVGTVRVQFRAANSKLILGNPATDADGNFKISDISAGEYRVVVVGMPPELYVKDVRLGGIDLMNQTIRVAENAPISGTIDVLLSPNVSQVDGLVRDDRQEPAPGVQVVLVPDRNREYTELFKAVTTDQYGKYSIKGLPPGDYKLFAWEALEPFGYFDPDLLKKSETQGKAVHITESSRQNIEIPWIRATQ